MIAASALLLVFCMTSFGQGCARPGNGRDAQAATTGRDNDASTETSASVAENSGPVMAILANAPQAEVRIAIMFIYTGQSLSPNAVFAWTHELVDSDTGERLSDCQESAGQPQELTLTCANAGVLSLSLVVSDGGRSYAPVTLLTTVAPR